MRRSGHRRLLTASGNAWSRRCRRTRGCCWTRCWRGACSPGLSMRRWIHCLMPSAGCAAYCCWCRARARLLARSCCAVPIVPLARRTPPGTGNTWARATETATMTLRAQATGRLRHPARGPHAPGCPELQTLTRPGALRAPRRCNPGPQRNQSQRGKPRTLKRLNRSRSRSRNPSLKQNQSRNWSQNRTQRPSPTQSPSPTSGKGTSLKIPEAQSADRLCPAHAG
ncbi:nucleolar protein 3 isoform X1 [Saimiri boliviensis]|uniref:nucleolar protein 3 isoform X1 n=1 Tax=Saimiri boliviensis TaxID=27679 RepID=UPI003D774727